MKAVFKPKAAKELSKENSEKEADRAQLATQDVAVEAAAIMAAALAVFQQIIQGVEGLLLYPDILDVMRYQKDPLRSQ